jgi:pyruvate dehydrogenase E1 component alpha subunit
MPGKNVDGNDVLAVREVVLNAADRARKGLGPTLIEAKTYRLSGHSKSDPRTYRSKEEEKAAWENDPIKRYKMELIGENILNINEIEEIENQIASEIEEAIEFAENSPHPEPEVAFEDLFVCSKEGKYENA